MEWCKLHVWITRSSTSNNLIKLILLQSLMKYYIVLHTNIYIYTRGNWLLVLSKDNLGVL